MARARRQARDRRPLEGRRRRRGDAGQTGRAPEARDSQLRAARGARRPARQAAHAVDRDPCRGDGRPARDDGRDRCGPGAGILRGRRRSPAMDASLRDAVYRAAAGRLARVLARPADDLSDPRRFRAPGRARPVPGGDGDQGTADQNLDQAGRRTISSVRLPRSTGCAARSAPKPKTRRRWSLAKLRGWARWRRARWSSSPPAPSRRDAQARSARRLYALIARRRTASLLFQSAGEGPHRSVSSRPA